MTDNQRQSTTDGQPETRDPAQATAEAAEQTQATQASAAVEGELQDGSADSATGASLSADDGADPEALRQRVEELEKALADAEQKAEEHWDQVLRMRAELENARRRAEKDVDQAKRQGLEKVCGDLLQVKDSLEMGVQAAEDAEADREKLLEGSQLTLKMLNQVFERFEIEEINPQGERFNPDYHEAMAAQPSDEQEPNTVLQVVQKGYRLQDRLLRPALVVVAKKGDGGAGSGGSVDETA
ncbi:nucleotide exchange factor GrpE [Halorhodospira halophila]|uniref:Protein GrpE n=1 Tax=Halorhodospira halophila (strain DSM 244 / SL1) TaxID=349124 RepID=GRPE_HALHL|nr:nucleotide exchange factor GrpE [Halorhodospira halophila]A1WX32.1 RecName: Full=Protein GrpE; AltName: Full=HSP-70 cofactor [Halorhodospira halophila SL1]ABM62244.1 GrpE protein [Halorhodospira halophila SL1]MBK1729219.1 nucleotide exchange factor GrpE [Halorhodospira halophila]